MNLGDLQFTGQRIFEICRNLTVVPGEIDSCDAIADAVNTELKERLEKATKVWGKLDYDFGVMVYFDDEDAPSGPTHRARLVCIEEIHQNLGKTDLHHKECSEVG